MKFFCLDERKVWHGPMLKVARDRGYDARRIFRGEECEGPGYGFIRPHADPTRLKANRDDFAMMSKHLRMVQDQTQVDVYEDKSAQFWRWREWMPDTWRFSGKDEAIRFAESADYPLVSKADVGASSKNVRILKTRAEGVRHCVEVFDKGIEVDHCAGGKKSWQKGYVLLQRFIPHKITWRVNIIGTKRAAFMRYCYPDKPVAQTGNVEPVMEMTEQVESLLEFCNRFASHAGTKWCALDVLQDGDEWRLLETSLAWPWPSPGKCNDAPIFGTDKKWIQLWDVMFDEIESGAW
jgi:biotin carboxylase